VKILLDECIDRRLSKEIEGYGKERVLARLGPAGVTRWSRCHQFDVFVTVDRNLAFQQHLPEFRIAVIVLQAPTNRLQDLLPLIKSASVD
jgi:hypothetical protein